MNDVTIFGTNAAETLQFHVDGGVEVSAGNGNDVVSTGTGNDIVLAGAGGDIVTTGDGEDTVYGDSGQVFVTGVLAINDDGPVTVTFNYEGAGYRNTFGAYKVDPDTGEITDVQIIWENASLQGSGGNLIGNVSNATIDAQSGDQLAFFIISNGFSQNNFAALGEGHYEFRNANGTPATLESLNPQLWFIADSGVQTRINGDKYHTAAYDGTLALNADGLLHTVGLLDTGEGTIKLGFEDLFNGGDKDYDDCVFTVALGEQTVELLNAHFSTLDLANDTTLAETYQNSTVIAAPGGDTIDGGAGHDTIYGEGANDTLMGGDGADLVDGDSGNDRVYGGTGGDILTGGIGDDYLNGDGTSVAGQTQGINLGGPTEAAIIANGGGNGEATEAPASTEGYDDTISGGDGNDIIDAGRGGDSVQGGNGNDIVFGADGDDALHGEAGNDKIYGAYDEDVVSGGIGTDLVHGGAGSDRVDGNDGDDEVYGGADDDLVSGGNGNDRVFGETGDDVLYGDAGNDQLFGDDGVDMLDGGNGNDLAIGGGGNDMVYGAAGIDDLYGSEGDDALYGGDDPDMLSGGQGNDLLNGDAGNDRLFGDQGNDQINGGGGDDDIFGDDGDDTATGGDGNDNIYLHSGNDTADGGAGADSMLGGGGSDQLHGGSADDRIWGGQGADTISGDAGGDTMWGGDWGSDGAVDTFVFAAGSGDDWIMDFTVGEDRIDLEALAVTNFAQIESAMINHGWATSIDLAALGGNAGDKVWLMGVNATALTQDMFGF